MVDQRNIFVNVWPFLVQIPSFYGSLYSVRVGLEVINNIIVIVRNTKI